MASLLNSVIDTILGQLGGVLDIIGVDASSPISFSASMGVGFFVTLDSLGFGAELKLGGKSTEFKCIFEYSSQKLKCEHDNNWLQLFLQSGRWVVQKINSFAGNVIEDVAEFFQDTTGQVGKKFNKEVVGRGKKVADRVKCKAKKILGGKCKKSGGTPSSCGDGTEYVIRSDDNKCLQASNGCYVSTPSAEFNFDSSSCYPVWGDCLWHDGRYEVQMRAFWFFTKSRYMCNEYMNQMYFGNYPDADSNPKCIVVDMNAQSLKFNSSSSSSTPTRFDIRKKSTERFKISMHDLGDYCLNSYRGDSLGGNQWKVPLRGFSGGRRRRRCDKGGAKVLKIYQKLNPGDGTRYETENGDAQFTNNCNR
eukprot:TRINITY_DN13664_c0_g3_i1.p1 TRINITY_DN13664_c0_g3~~TRINITY_DN13664_c0_g3_i1.p1  ORF type:complete len:401 (-),score=39.53 TRINITY_DN13664_c0_g3_i1:315-1403(-)